MAMEGMNVDAVRQISRDLKAQAGLLNGVSVRIDGFIDRTQNQWRGTDATDFQSWWRNQHKAKVVQLVQDLEGLAQSLSNNSDEQDRASGGSLSPGSAGPTTGTGGSSSTGHLPETTPGLASLGADAAKIADEMVRSAAAESFKAQYLHQSIDTDQNGAWCFDVFRKYSTDVLHAPLTMASGNYSNAASDIYKQYGSNETQNYYDRIPFGTQPPQAGDIIVYDNVAPWNKTYGHVGLVVEGGDSFKTMEQAVGGSTTAEVYDRSTSSTHGILGYLRPKAHS